MEETMKYSRTCKELMEKELEEQFRKYPNFIVSNYLGLSSNDLNAYRREAQKTNSKYFVIKNKICRRVLSKIKLEDIGKDIDGGIGITFIGGDAVAASKMILDFCKTHEPFVVRSGYIEGKRLDSARIKYLASLPSREVLLSMVLSAMQSPISGFVGVLNGVLRKFVYAINAIKDKKSENK